MLVAIVVLRLEHDRLHRSSPDAILAQHLEVVVARQRLLLLGQERREHVAKRRRHDAHQLRVRIVGTQFRTVAHDLARRSVEVDELRLLAMVGEEVHDARRLHLRPGLVDDRADVVELAGGLRRPREPRHRVVGVRTGCGERKYKYGRDDPAGKNAKTTCCVLHR
ncbi:MAG TPA: hypothetical protein VG865_03310 [Casimicrobiaceae bacterium]|nr:hypothetical protein [Casimicrobiaceae bacterium]